jgi:hypothetical protein
VGKHCSNPQCFKEKNYIVKFSTSSILKKIKLTKINLEKIIKKNKNRVWKHCNNPRCFKEKNNKAKFSISLISKK